MVEVSILQCVCVHAHIHIHPHVHAYAPARDVCVYAYECAVMCASHTFILVLYKHWNSIDQILEMSRLNE